MRPLLIALTATFIAACGAKTPPCTSDAVKTEVIGMARAAIREGLLKNDPDMRTDHVMSKLGIALVDIETTDHNEGIDKHSCSATLRITLPPEVAALKDHRAFRAYARLQADVPIEGNAIVAPITYSSYLSEQEKALIVDVDGERPPAKFIEGAHKAGAFDVDLTALPDLHAGLTLYNTKGKHLLIRPNEAGSLEFHMNFENTICRPWTQVITAEQGSTLVYDNPEVGCSVIFSRLGGMLLVEHEGCDLMAEACFPDGIYQRQ